MEKIINKAEQMYKNNKNKDRLQIFINKCYLAFLSENKIEYLKKAYFTIEEYLTLNKTDLDMILLICFFSLEQKNKEEAEKYINIISKYKKYLKNNEPIKYSFYIYLIALQKYNKNKNISKYIKILQSYNKDNFKEISLMIIDLKFRNESLERDDIFEISINEKTYFLTNLLIYKLLEKSSKFFNIDKNLFKNYIKWGYNNKLNIENSVNKYKNYLNFEVDEDSFNKRFYEFYKNDIILKTICETYLQQNKFSEISFFFYKEAIKKQIDLENLAFYYIKGCYKFKVEEIGLYPIKQFLNNLNIDFEIVPFVYHIILTNKKYSELIKENHIKILQFGNYFLEKKCVGRYYFTIYKYMLDNLENNPELENRILEIIYPIYYKYEIEFFNEKAKWIYIKNNEITTIKKYEIKDKKCYINAISNNFSYYIFDDQEKEILSCNLNIKKIIQDNSTKLVLKFYTKNLKDKFTLINLGTYFININKVPNKALDILIKILEIDDLSNIFRMKLLQIIGNIYFESEDYNNANIYYKKVSEKYINNKDINNILLTYVNCLENEKAIDIIKKKAHLLNEDILYTSLRKISENEQFDKEIAPFVYEMLMKSKIDNLFIDIVLNHYKGCLNEWIQLRNVLQNVEVLRKKVDEYILKETIYTHNLNSESEKVFISIFKDDVNNSIIKDFLNYCIYEAIFSEYKFLNETIEAMEQLFIEYKYEDVGYGLAHIYLKQDFDIEEKSIIFDEIIFNLEKLNINFNIFEENKDKLKKYAYILKNTPFIYNSLPNKDIYLFYKELNEESYKSVKMKYFKFGIYICTLPIFFGEEIEYYFTENMDTGSVSTKKYTKINNYNQIFEDIEDEYFKINNGIIYSYEGKYHLTHELIENTILRNYNLKGNIL